MATSVFYDAYKAYTDTYQEAKANNSFRVFQPIQQELQDLNDYINKYNTAIIDSDSLAIDENAEGIRNILSLEATVPLPNWINSSGGTVSSVSAGDGMDFTNISGTGDVIMGTPSDITSVSTNSVSSTSHTHSLDDNGVTPGDYNSANISVDSKGRITSVSNGANTDDVSVERDSNGNITLKPFGKSELLYTSGFYDGYGNAIDLGNGICHYYFRRSTEHGVNTNGRVMRIVYNYDTDTVVSNDEVFDSVGNDDRHITAGFIGSDIYVFINRHDGTNWLDIGYITSSDNGQTWSSFTTVYDSSTEGYNSFSTFGTSLIETGTAGRYAIGYFGRNDTLNTTSWGLIVTTDSGANWGVVTGGTGVSGPGLVDLSDYNAEPCLAYIGERRVIASLRNIENASVKMFKSDDDGENWGEIGELSMSNKEGYKPFTTINASFFMSSLPNISYDQNTGKVYMFVLDRFDRDVATGNFVGSNEPFASAYILTANAQHAFTVKGRGIWI
jgi:hypothetical protein